MARAGHGKVLARVDDIGHAAIMLDSLNVLYRECEMVMVREKLDTSFNRR